MKKFLFALLLPLCMMLGFLSVTVLADGEAGNGAYGQISEAVSETDAVKALQELIDALPEDTAITQSSSEAVIIQLEAIDKAKCALSDSERALVDFTRYNAAIAVLNALDGMAEAGEPAEAANQFLICYKSGLWSYSQPKSKFGDALKVITKNASYEDKIILQEQAQEVSGNHTMPKTDFKICVSNINFKGKLTVPNGATVTIYGYDGADKSSCTVKEIEIETGGRLNLENVTLNGPINITGVGVLNVNSNAVVNGDVYNYGLLNNNTDSNGVINGKVTNDGGWIFNGIFNGKVANNIKVSPGLIKGGTYNDEVTNDATIEDGTFNETVTNYGTIENGAFGPNLYNYGTIKYATVTTKGVIINNYGTIEDGSFRDTYPQNKEDSIVKGGDFHSDTISRKYIYKVSFSAGEGVSAEGMPAVQWRFNWPATKPTEVPTRSDGQVLQYWYLEGDATQTPYTFTDNITSNITLVAKWTESLGRFSQWYLSSNSERTYNGAVQKFSIIIQYQDNNGEFTILEENKDYTVSGTRSAKDVGSYTVTVTGTGNYRGTLDIPWEIKPKNLEASNIEIKLDKTEFTYNEGLQAPTVITKHNLTTQDSYELVSGRDYIAYGAFSAMASGDYQITFIGKGNYTGTKTVTWKIAQAEYDQSKLVIPSVSAIYGQTLADVELPDGWFWNDSEVTDVGKVGQRSFSATYIPDDLNYLSAEVFIPVNVEKADLSTAYITPPTAKGGLIFNGQEQILIDTAIITGPEGCRVYYKTQNGAWVDDIADIKGLNADDYTVYWYISGGDNFNDYGSQTSPKSLTVSIARRDLEIDSDGLNVLITPEEYDYNGSNRNFNATVWLVDAFNKKIYDLSADVELSGDTVGIGVGTYIVTVTGKGNLTGTKQIEWKINKAAAPTAALGALDIYIDRAYTYTFDFKDILPNAIADNGGAITYEILSVTDSKDISKPLSCYADASDFVLSGSKLTMPVKALKNGEAGYIGSIKVTVKSRNYEDVELELRVSAKGKAQTDVMVAGMPVSVTYGDTFILSASQKDEIGGIWSWTVDDEAFEIVSGAGTATVTLRAKKATESTEIRASYTGDTHIGISSNIITVLPKEITVDIVISDNITYRDVYTVTATPNNTLNGDNVSITLTYTGVLDKNGSAYNSTEKPIEAGNYKVKASTLNTNYFISEGEYGEKSFSINKLTPTLKNVIATIPANSTDLDQIIFTYEGEAGIIKPNAGQTLLWGTAGKVEISYTFTPEDENVKEVYSTVTVVLSDTVSPTGEVSLGQSISKEFLSNTGFELLFKDEQTLKVTAYDSLSGVASIEYYESAEQLTLAQIMELNNSSWSLMEKNKSSSSVTVPAVNGKRFIYYIRITDYAGNVTYLSTKGAAFDTAAPVISGVTDGGVYYTTQVITVTDDNPSKLTVNSSVSSITVSPYSCELNGNTDQVYVITATDALGNSSTVTITMRRLSTVTDLLEGYSTKTVTSADRNDLTGIEKTLDELLKSGKPSESEKSQLTAAKEKVKTLLDKIEETESSQKNLTDAVDTYDKNKVTSEDKKDITDLITEIDKLLNGDNLTDSEKAELTEVKKAAKDLIDIIEAAASADKTENTDKVKEVTADNVNLEDKSDLEKARDDLEKALDDYKNNLTETEKKVLQEKIEQINKALDSIENVKTVEALIDKLPDNITTDDAASIKKASEAYETLTEHEKSLLDKTRLEAANSALEKLNKTNSSDSPATGDNSLLWLLTLMFSAGSLLVLSFKGKKKYS